MNVKQVFRKICAAATAIVMISALASIANIAEASTCSIKIDGKIISSDASPYVKNNTTMVPIAVITNYLGGTSSWNQSDRTATIVNGDKTVVVKIGSTTATVNGVKSTLSVAPEIVTVDRNGGGRTMVPLRFMAEAFQYSVSWISSSRTAVVDTAEAVVSDGAISSISIVKNQSWSDEQTAAGVLYTFVNITSDISLQSMGIVGHTLTGPDRYYMDFAGFYKESGVSSKMTSTASNSYVSAVRTSYDEAAGKVRVVVDLKSACAPLVRYSDDGKTMTVAFPENYVGTGTDTGTDTSKNTTPANSTDDTGLTGTITQTVQGTYKDDTVEHYQPYADGKLVVAIDPGHGTTTGGKRSPDGSLREYEFNRSVAYKLKALLQQQGISCVMTVALEDKTDPSLANRVATANNAGNVDLFVSIHANAFGNGTDWNSAKGWEVYSYKKGGVSEIAAKCIEASTKASSLGLSDRGCKTANFYVIKNTEMPAVLIEHAFFTNKEECDKLKSDTYRDEFARADCEGIVNFFNKFK